MPHTPVLILGLDGGTWTVLEPLIARGVMPELARLRDAGCWSQLNSTVPHITAPAWTTFMTGKNPGKHGVFHFVDADDEAPLAASNGQRTLVDARSIRTATLWEVLSYYGRRVGIVNMPLTYPPFAVSGFMISGLLTPSGAAVFTYPPELSRRLDGYRIEVDRFVARMPFESADGHEPIPADVALVGEFQELMDEHAAVALQLMVLEPWDVFTIVFAEPDRMGHYLWPYLRAEDLDGSPQAAMIHDAVVRYFRRLDEWIGKFVGQAGAPASVIVISDHGMGPVPSKRVHWNSWLADRGWVVPKENPAGRRSPDALFRRLRIPRDTLGRWVRAIPGLNASTLARKARRLPGLEVDRERSKAVYDHLYNSVGGVRINRRALGPGSPEEIERRYLALRDRLILEIQTLFDPQTGKLVVRRVGPREQYYAGPYADQMPDIIIELYPDYAGSQRLSHYHSPITEVLAKRNPGGHWPEGIFIASGRGIREAGFLALAPGLADIAPTVLHLAGCPVPADMDGAVLEVLLTDEHRQAHPVQRGQAADDWFTGRPYATEALTEDETAEVMKRLADLGYMAS